MPIKVLLADDSDVMRSAMRRILEDEPRIVVVGEAATFAKTIQMIGDLKPEVLLLDLHMAEKRAFQPELVTSQLACVCALAVSFSNDAEAWQLAESYGAVALLDKKNVVADDKAAVRLGIIQMLKTDTDLEVAGEATTFAETQGFTCRKVWNCKCSKMRVVF
jgi:DNA-binding NarL/FixJ family response regulator